MPQIPRAYSEAPFPLVPTSPGMAGLPFEGAEKIAEASSRAAERAGATAEYGAQVYNFLQRAQDNVEALKIKNNLSADFDEEAQKYLLRSDYKKFQEDATQFTEDTRKKYDEIIGKNPRLQKAFETYFGIQSRKFNHIVKLKEAHETQKEGQTQFLMDMDYTAGQIAGEPDENKKEWMRTELQQEAEFLIGSHILDRTFAYEKLKTLDAKAEEVEIVNGVKSLDVPTIEGTLDKLNQPGSFPNVDPVKKANFLAFGEGRVENLSRKYQGEIDKRNIDKGFKDLKEKFTVGEDSDYSAMRKQLRSPSFQKENNISLSQAEAIERGINLEEAGVEKDKKDQDEKKIEELLPKLDQNKLSYSDVDGMVNKHQLSLRAGNILKSAIHRNFTETKAELRETRTEDRLARQEKSDAIFGLLSAKIINGIPVDTTTEIYGSMKDGLSWKHANELVRMNKEPTNPDFKLGVSVIDDAFNNKIIDAPTRGKAILDLQDAVKRDKLIGKAIIDKANEIVHPKTRSWIGRTLDKIMGFGESTQQTDIGLATSHVSGQKADKFGYYIGQTKNVKGQNWKYIGNDQWQKQ